MAARRVIMQTGPAGTPSIPPHQIRRDPAFIQENVLPDIPEWQPLAPLTTGGGDVRPVLFVGV
jgi:hypothetical protein